MRLNSREKAGMSVGKHFSTDRFPPGRDGFVARAFSPIVEPARRFAPLMGDPALHAKYHRLAFGCLGCSSIALWAAGARRPHRRTPSSDPRHGIATLS